MRSTPLSRASTGAHGSAEHLGEILVSATGQAHEVELAVGLGEHPGERVRGLERRDDALQARQLL